MKKKIILTITAALLITSFAVLNMAESAELPFKDVPNTHWAYSYIKNLYNEGIVNGVSKDTFGTNQSLSRAQFIVMLARAAYDGEFTQGENDKWDTPSINFFADKGLLKGTSFENLAENPLLRSQNIKRSDMAVILYNVLNDKDKLPTSYSASYKDVSENIEEIAPVSSTGILTGYSDGTFKPDNTLTRAEGSTVIDRIVRYIGGADLNTENATAATERKAEAEAVVKTETQVSNLGKIYDLATGEYIVPTLEGTHLARKEISFCELPRVSRYRVLNTGLPTSSTAA